MSFSRMFEKFEKLRISASDSIFLAREEFLLSPPSNIFQEMFKLNVFA